MHNNWRDQLNFLLYKQTSLTFVLNALIDFYFLDSSRKPTFLLLSRPSWSILHVKQVELAPGSSQTTRNSLVSKLPKVPTNKTNFKNYFLMESIFQNAPNFIGTSGHWSRIPVPSMKLLAHLLLVFKYVDVYMY